MTFTVTKLVNNRALVQGTDAFGNSGQEVLDSSQWDELNIVTKVAEAQKDFDAEVERFFEPIMEAAEKAEAATALPEADPSTYVVLSEGSEGVAPQREHRVHLNRDSVVLRLISEGNDDRLVWVNEHLEVLAQAEAPVEDSGSVLPEDANING